MQAQLIIVDPAHFHAALLQREMYPDVARRVSVYAPLGPELLDYLNRIALFNSCPDHPTQWELDVHCSAGSMREMLREPAGGVVLFTGRNRAKIDRILSALSSGLNVLADKPWIISSADIPKLEDALAIADRKGLIAYDIMTERYEVTSQLQRIFVNNRSIFGELEKGSAQEPGVTARSVHHVMKVVAGVPLRRPAWFFDVAEYGEGLADVGTHVVDLVQWTVFPNQSFDYSQDIRVRDGRRWPLKLSKEQFQRVTGESDFSSGLLSQVHEGQLDYYCNNSVCYTLRGIHVRLEIVWNWEAPAGSGDVYEAAFRGTRARVEIRQGDAEKFSPELYIVPVDSASRLDVIGAVREKVASLQDTYPGLAAEESAAEVHIAIPEEFRVGHEAHFVQVANRFFEYWKSRASLPHWERPNMLAKYYVSTKGVEFGRAG